MVFISEAASVRFLNAHAVAFTNLGLDRWSWEAAIHPRELPALLKSLSLSPTLHDTGSPAPIEVRFRHADGSYRWHLVQLTPRAGGEWLGTATDIDDQVRARSAATEQSALFAAITECAPDPIFVKDLEDRYLYVNPACERIFGLSAGQLVGKRPSELVPTEIGARIRAEDAEIVTTRQTKTFEGALIVNNTPRTFATTKAPLFRSSDEVEGVIGVARDLAKEQQALDVAEAARAQLTTIAAIAPNTIHAFRRAPDGTMSFPFAAENIKGIYGVDRELLAQDASPALEVTVPEDRARVVQAIQDSARTMTPFHCELRVNHPSKGLRWIEVCSTPAADPDGGVTWHGVLSDITARHQAEDAVRAERDRLANIAATSPGVIHTFRRSLGENPTVTYPFLSPRIVEVMGVTADEIRQDYERCWVHILPEDRDRLLSLVERSTAEVTAFSVQFRVNHPDKGLLWVEASMSPTRERDGSVTFQGVFTDITAYKTALERARASEAALRSIFAAAPDFILSVDLDLTIRFINRTSEWLRLEDVIGTSALDYIPPDFIASARAVAEKVLRDGTIESIDLMAATGADTQGWFHARVGPIFAEDRRVTGFTICVSDVGERRHAEDALRVSEARYRSLVSVLPDGIYVNRGGRITFANPAMSTLTGRGAEELLGLDPFELFDPNDHAAKRASMELMLATGQPNPPVERTLRLPDGSKRRIRLVASPIEDGREPAFLVVCHDLSDVDRTERLLSTVLESVTDAILTVDARGLVETMNPAVTHMFGYQPAELRGRNVGVLMSDEDRRKHDELLSHFSPENARYVGRGARELEGRRKDGSTFPLELSLTSFELDDRIHFTGVIRDITDRKRLEEQFRQAHKMEAFGQLAGGVAHDFNNVLTVILGETEIVLGQLPANDPLSESVTDIYEAGQRAASLTRQLLAFSRKTVLEPKTIDVNAVIRETEKILRRLIGEDIRLRFKPSPYLRPVRVDPTQLSQVLMNLAVNARDAMPRGGELCIDTSTVEALPARALEGPDTPPANAAGYVLITVRDTGHGMSKEVRERVFQPFFTTKAVGKGTGLGLAVVHGIVSQSGGRIAVVSAPHAGCTFELYFPAVEREVATPQAREGASGVAGTETVLLVEDDNSVRRLATRTLSAKGYHVLLARHGAEALEVLERQGYVDLVITDVVMPVMGGQHLAEVLSANARTKILYTSGYTDDVLIRHGLMREAVAFLAKPYSPATLLLAVRSLLDSKHEEPAKT